MPIRLWVDADACPGPVKEIVFRAATRRRIHTTLVANHVIRVPRSPYLKALRVESGFDMADQRILDNLSPGDLVITGDIPLAAQVIAAQAAALNPRGTFYTPDNVREHLARRDFLDGLRATGVVTGGPSALDKTHIQTFANELDKYLTRQGH